MNYDSKADTLLHIKRVAELMTNASSELIRRANVHDNSKLESPEKELFDEYTPKLAGSTYGSDEYKEFLKQLKVGLDHHYQNNSHHPEHTFSKEKWVDIIGYEGIYQISDLGRVKRLKTEVIRNNQGNFTKDEMIKKPHITPKGYVRIQLTNKGQSKNYFIHTLVANHFIGRKDNKQVNHKDGNKLNNSVNNLEFLTSSENLQHAYDNDLRESNVKYVVHCKELDITTFGTLKMEQELRSKGYEKAAASAIWRCINSTNESHSHLGLHFESWNINEYRTLNSPVNGFDLFDLMEMAMDWCAAVERHNDGDIFKSLEINTKRFELSNQIVCILNNTFKRLQENGKIRKTAV